MPCRPGIRFRVFKQMATPSIGNKKPQRGSQQLGAYVPGVDGGRAVPGISGVVGDGFDGLGFRAV